MHLGTLKKNGLKVAVKVQRPTALRQCLLDGAVIILALKAIQGRYWNGDLLAIFDLVASGSVEELDFRNEANNLREGGRNLRARGCEPSRVRVPSVPPRHCWACASRRTWPRLHRPRGGRVSPLAG